jgi:hypothetical protein
MTPLDDPSAMSTTKTRKRIERELGRAMFDLIPDGRRERIAEQRRGFVPRHRDAHLRDPYVGFLACDRAPDVISIRKPQPDHAIM